VGQETIIDIPVPGIKMTQRVKYKTTGNVKSNANLFHTLKSIFDIW